MDSPPPAPRDAAREERIETERVRDLVDRLYKAVRAVLLYPASSPLPPGFQRALHESLTEHFADNESLVLTVSEGRLLHDGKVAHQDAGGEIDLTGALARDGIESITFLRGVTLAELVRFLELIKRAVKERSPDEDLVTMFWEASFRRIRYKVVASLDKEDAPPPARGKAPKSAGRARDDAGLGTGAATASGPGDGGDPEAVAAAEAAKTAGVAGILSRLSDFAADSDRGAEFRREAAEFDPAASLVGIILEVLGSEETAEGFTETADLIDSLYDRLVGRGDFGAALSLYDGLRGASREETESESPRALRLRASLERPADRVRVGKLVAALNAHGDGAIEGARRLLSELPEEAAASLAAALGEIEGVLARKMSCDVLAERGAARVDEIGAMVLDPRWFVVRNAAQVLSRIGGPRAAAHLAKAASHPDPKVRRAVLDGAARISTPEAAEVLRAALADPDEELQLRALRALSSRRDAGAGEIAERRILSGEFRRAPHGRQREWLGALARIRGDAAVPTLKGFIAPRSFFERSARRYLRLVAVSALGECSSPGAAAYLAELAGDRDELVRDAAALALDRSRREPREKAP